MQLRKEKEVTFEDGMTNMVTQMNNILLKQTIEKTNAWIIIRKQRSLLPQLLNT